jgi:hypothetical protein
VEALDSNLKVEAAFWWMDDDTWRLVLVTPLVPEQGPLSVYSRVRDVIEAAANVPRELFHRVEVVSPSAGVVTMLDLAGKTPPLDRLILDESINGVYVAGAYFYKFQPRNLREGIITNG